MTHEQQTETTETTQTTTQDQSQEQQQQQAQDVNQNPPANDQNGEQEQPKEQDADDSEMAKGTLPESADAYEVALDGFDFEQFAANESNKAFIEKAHNLGMTNEQMTAVLEAYSDHVVVQVEALKEEWGGEFDRNIRYASQAAKAAGLDMDDIDSPTMGIKLAAFFGKQLQEDTPPDNTQQSSADDVKSLMLSEAYANPNHPDHGRVYAQVQAAYEKRHK